MENKHIQNAIIFKAFCDETRLMVIDMIKTGEKCACVLLDNVNVRQSTLSHHMKILTQSGIVKSRKDGKWTYYSISKTGLECAENILLEIKKSNQ